MDATEKIKQEMKNPEKGISRQGAAMNMESMINSYNALEYAERLREGLRGHGLTADDYQRAAMRTASGMQYSLFDDPNKGLLLNGVMGLNGEAGECIDIVKKSLFQGHELDRDHLIEELGDCAWYLAVAAYALDVPLSEVLQRNINKLKERYPEGFDKARSVNRDDAS